MDRRLVYMSDGRLGVRTSIPSSSNIHAKALYRMLVTSKGEVRPGSLPRGRALEVEASDGIITAVVELITSEVNLASESAVNLFHDDPVNVEMSFKILFQLVLFLEHYHITGWLQRYPLTIFFLPTCIYFDNDGSLVFSLCESLYYSLNSSEWESLPFLDPYSLKSGRKGNFHSLIYSIGALMLHFCTLSNLNPIYTSIETGPQSHLLRLLHRFIESNPEHRITATEFKTDECILTAFEVLHMEYRMLDAMGSTPLIVAASCNNLPMIQRNLTQRKQKNFLGYTALVTAVINHHLEPLQILAPIEGREQMTCGETALIIACKEEFLEAIPILAPIEAGESDYFGETALMLAAANNWTFAVQLLLSKECVLTTLPHHRCGPGFTALMAAGQANAKDAFKLLLPLEYHISQPSSFQFPHGRTVRQWCEEFQSTDCIALLDEYEQHTRRR